MSTFAFNTGLIGDLPGKDPLACRLFRSTRGFVNGITERAMNLPSPSPVNATSASASTPTMLAGVGKIVVAIHGIGNQYHNATVQSVVKIFSRCFEQAVAVPL